MLPFAAVLRGLEVFHASAVAVPGGAWAFAGASTAGKTSLAVNLAVRGARFLTDDVVALATEGDRLVAHPGVAVASVRHTALEQLTAAERKRLGRALGRDSNALRVALDGRGEAAPLRALYLLERQTTCSELTIEHVEPVELRTLLLGSFNFVITTPERLMNQLDVCARVARSVPVYRICIPPSAGPAEVAERLWQRALQTAA